MVQEITKQCTICDKPFTTTNIHTKCCGPICVFNHIKENKTPVKCKNCNNMFIRNKNRLYCNVCRNIGRKIKQYTPIKKRTIHCRNCNRETTAKTKLSVYCSECSNVRDKPIQLRLIKERIQNGTQI